MHFPSVVHLAPRRNDLFDVYSRSLTLIKITANPRFASLFFFLFFSLSLSFSFFWGSFLISPPSFVLPFVVPKDSPQGMETEPPSGFSLFTLCRTLVFSWERSLLLFRAWKFVRVQSLQNHDANSDSLCVKISRKKRITFFKYFYYYRFSSKLRKFLNVKTKIIIYQINSVKSIILYVKIRKKYRMKFYLACIFIFEKIEIKYL